MVLPFFYCLKGLILPPLPHILLVEQLHTNEGPQRPCPKPLKGPGLSLALS